jgi:cation diffusion facilitator CzcD-associated flavoprotein CzcO
VAKIVPNGVVMAGGTTTELDVLVYATGFDVHAYMRPMQVTGLNGLTVDEVWKDNIFSYRGVALPGFPNMFLLYGPFSPVNNIPVPMGLDQEIGYIMKLIEESRRKRVAIAPTAAATQGFLERMRSAMPGTVWFGACRNWYSDQQGIPILWPFVQEEHRKMLEEVAAEELEYLPAARDESRPSA